MSQSKYSCYFHWTYYWMWSKSFVCPQMSFDFDFWCAVELCLYGGLIGWCYPWEVSLSHTFYWSRSSTYACLMKVVLQFWGYGEWFFPLKRCAEGNSLFSTWIQRKFLIVHPLHKSWASFLESFHITALNLHTAALTPRPNCFSWLKARPLVIH